MMSGISVKRLMALGVSGLLALTMAAGCSGGGDTSSNTSKTPGNSQGGDPSSTVVEKPAMDLKGRVIEVRMFGRLETFTEEDGAYYNSVKETEEKYKCTFNFVEMPILDLIAAVEQAHLAGVAEFDVAMVEGYHAVPKMAVSKQYLNLSEYYDFSADAEWQNDVIKDVGVYQGNRYAFPIGGSSDMGIFYNKALMREANLEDPWTYVENDTWNFENFKKFAKALTKDSNNDGTPEQFGFVAEETFEQFIVANGGALIDASGDAPTFVGGDENGMEAINFVLGMYDERIIPTTDDMANAGINGAFNGMATGKVAMFPYGAGYGPYLIDEGGMAPEDVGWIYFPKGPKATEYVAPVLTPQNMFMVLADVEKPEEVVGAMQDMMCFWSETKASKTTYEELRQESANADANLDFLTGNNLTVYMDLTDKAVCVNTLSYTAARDLIKTMFYDIQTKALTPAAAMDTYKGQIQSAIDSLVNPQ